MECRRATGDAGRGAGGAAHPAACAGRGAAGRVHAGAGTDRIFRAVRYGSEPRAHANRVQQSGAGAFAHAGGRAGVARHRPARGLWRTVAGGAVVGRAVSGGAAVFAQRRDGARNPFRPARAGAVHSLRAGRHRSHGHAGRSATVPPVESVAHAHEPAAVRPASDRGVDPPRHRLGDRRAGRHARGVDGAMAHPVAAPAAARAGHPRQPRRSAPRSALWRLAVGEQPHRTADGLCRPLLSRQPVSARDGGVLHGAFRRYFAHE